MPAPTFALATLMAVNLSHDRGGRTVLRNVSLTVGPSDCVGVVGPNGVGKSTLLSLLAGMEAPLAGSIRVDPPSATVGYLAQEHEAHPGETVRAVLTRRTGVATAEIELATAAGALVEGRAAERRYEVALERYTALSAGDLDARIDTVLADLGLGTAMADRQVATLSGGQEARLALAAIVLSRFDITLLDEPTNDLDFEGLERLESFVLAHPGGLVVVSHDRAFLDRTVTSVLELDEHDHTGRLYGGGWAGYLAERETTRRHQLEDFAVYQSRRAELAGRARRERQWATSGVRREKRNPRDNDKAQRDFRINRTEQLASRARRTERALNALEVVDKPWEGWDLRFSIEQAPRAGAVVARLTGAVIERGRLHPGPARPGDRVGRADRPGWTERVGQVDPGGSDPRPPAAPLRDAMARPERRSRRARAGPTITRWNDQRGRVGHRTIRADPLGCPVPPGQVRTGRRSCDPARRRRCPRVNGPEPSWPRSRPSGSTSWFSMSPATTSTCRRSSSWRRRWPGSPVPSCSSPTIAGCSRQWS